MFQFQEPFSEFAAILLVTAAVGAVATRLKQPLVVAFIAAGILVGPSMLGLITAEHEVQLLAEIGISLLLFVVGLKLDLHVIRSMGPVALSTGLGQVGFTSFFGFLICLLLGMTAIGSLYVAVALTFSSTIIIVKILSDKREIDALHGRIAVGFLIVQDIVVVLLLICLSAFGAGEQSDQSAWQTGLMVLLKGGLWLAGLALFVRYVLSGIMKWIAKSQELLLLFAVGWAISQAALGDSLGFSKEVGAFLAGVSLASTPYRESISGRLVSLRDFLLFFFFIHLGASLEMDQIGGHVGPALLLSAFVLVGNPLIVMVIMGLMGYRRRTGFLAGLTVAQISEFSLILGSLGVTLGHIDRGVLGLITLVGLITIGLSAYMILYSHKLYEWLSPYLGIFEREVPHREMAEETSCDTQYDVIVFGLGRYGSNIAFYLRDRGRRVLGVDFDPQVVADWHARGLAAQYGDAEDPEFPASLPLGTPWIVSTTPTVDTNLQLLRELRERDYAGKIVLTAHTRADAQKLEQAGADLALLPFVDAAEQAADLLTDQQRTRPI